MATSAPTRTDRTAGTVAELTARRTVLLLVLLCGVLATLVLTGADPGAVPAGDADMWITTDWEVRSPGADAPDVTAL
jgi:hypothetical protein